MPPKGLVFLLFFLCANPSPVKPAHPELLPLLQTAFTEFHSQFHLERDPISHVHRYSDPGDQEVVGFLAALMAYGNVTTILGSLYKVLLPLGDSPKTAVKNLGNENLHPHFRHRFTTGEDLWVILARLKEVYARHETLEDFFLAGPASREMAPLLSSFVERFFELPVPPVISAIEKRRARSLKYLISHPSRGSACKRLNLFLRWMARPKDGVDLGLWQKLGPAPLLLPVDTHLLKVLRELKWTKSKVANWKVAEEATAQLRKIAPEDPVRFDFSLCHLSMSGHSIKQYWKQKKQEPS